MKKKYRFHTYVIAMASLCLLLACLGCNSGTTSTKEGSISFELEREDTLQTSSVQAKTKASPRWLQFVKSLILPDTATAELDCDGISAIEAFVYDSSGELVNSGGPWDCILRHGSIDNIPEGINYSVVITAQNEVGLDLYRGEKKEISVEEGKNTDAGIITMERVYLYPLEISFEPDDVEPVWDESQGRWRYDFNYIVENPNNVPVEIIAFGQFNECLGTPDECSYTPDQFEAWMTGCNEVTTSIPAHGSACDNEWSVNGYADNGDVTGQYAVWYRDDQGEPQVALSAPLTLRQPPALSVYYRDGDGDGYGNPESSTEAPSPPSGYVTDNTDCNDSDASINPGATEIRGNDIDENCDGIVAPALNTYYRDADGDGYGNPASSTEAPSPPSGYIADSTDCNDSDASINPGATEIRGNDIDENCDGIVSPALNTYYRDADGDGYGNPASSVEAATPPSGYVTDNTDCNDTDASIHPGATDTPGDGIDQNCDGIEPFYIEKHYIASGPYSGCENPPADPKSIFNIGEGVVAYNYIINVKEGDTSHAIWHAPDNTSLYISNAPAAADGAACCWTGGDPNNTNIEGVWTVDFYYNGEFQYTDTFTVVNTTSEPDLFKVTELTYSINDDLDAIVKEEFGNEYRIADWTDVEAAFDRGVDPDDILAGGSAFCTNQGEHFWSGDRHYIVSRHNHEPSSGYLAHDDIDDHLFSLGSWYDNYRILAIYDPDSPTIIILPL